MGGGKTHKHKRFQAHLRFGDSIFHASGTIENRLWKTDSHQRESKDGEISPEYIVCVLNTGSSSKGQEARVKGQGSRGKGQGSRKIHSGMFESGFVVVIDLKGRGLYVKAHNRNHLFNGVWG